MHKSRKMLHLNSFLVFIASSAILVLALILWFLTLEEKANFFNTYSQLPINVVAAYQEQVHLRPKSLTLVQLLRLL